MSSKCLYNVEITCRNLFLFFLTYTIKITCYNIVLNNFNCRQKIDNLVILIVRLKVDWEGL